MARPGKQTVDYFPHDAGASDGKTLFVLQSRFGNDGYAFWFKLLEILALTEGHYYDYRKPADWQFLLAKTGVSADIGTEILAALSDVAAIDKELYEHKIVWCQKFIDNLTDLYKRRKIGFPCKPVVSTDNNSINVNNNPVSASDNPQTKVNKTKVNKTIKEEVKEESSCSNSSKENEDVFETYRNNIGELSEDMENEIVLAVKRFTPQWVIDAIREAVLHNKRTWVYVAGILKNWERFGKDTVKPKNKNDPDKFIKGKYGHMVKR